MACGKDLRRKLKINCSKLSRKMKFLAQFAGVDSILCWKLTFLKYRRFNSFFWALSFPWKTHRKIIFIFSRFNASITHLSVTFTTLEILFSSFQFEMNVLLFSFYLLCQWEKRVLSAYRILKVKVLITKQFDLKDDSCCNKCHWNFCVKSIGDFPYFLMYHYSPVDLQKETSIHAVLVPELVYLKLDGKWK